MDNMELAYIAGFFDGEGCIYVVKMFKNAFEKGNPGYSLKLEIPQRSDNSGILYYIQSKFGGNIHHKKPTFNSNAHSRWSIHGDQAIVVLVQLLPYLKLKKLQAEVAISYSEAKNASDKEAIRIRLQELKLYRTS